MFYANVFLAKKSALTRVWLAAHWDKKLTKAHVYETNIAESIGEIISPKQKLALRTTGHLLLGVVRIYSRKAKYLLTDCSEAFVKIKMAFRPGVVDMPEENREAPMHAVTLPEVFHDFDSTLMDFGGLDMAQFGHNQGRLEDITMREDLSQNKVFTLGDFEEPANLGNMEFSMGLEDPELARKEAQLDQMREESMVVEEPVEKSTLLQESVVNQDDTTMREAPVMRGDMLNMPEMSELGGEFLDQSLNFTTNLTGDYSQLETAEEAKQYSTGLTPHQSMMTPHHLGMTSPHASRYATGMTPQHPMGMTPKQDTPSGHYITRQLGGKEIHEPMQQVADDEYLLDPIMDPGDFTRTRKKRKLVIDQEKQLSSDFIRRELDSTNDIVQAPSFAPPTRKSMHWKATAGVDKLFSTPGRPGLGGQLNKLLTHNLTLSFPNEEDEDDDIVSVHDDDDEVPEVKVKSPVKEASPVKKPDVLSPTKERRASISSDDDAGGDDFFDLNFGNDDSSSDEEQPTKKPKTDGELSDVEEKEGETFEDFDNRRWNKRTHAVLCLLRQDLDAKGEVKFFAFAEGNNRKQAASKFYSLLLLKKSETINVTQSEPFAEIVVHAGPKYHET